MATSVALFPSNPTPPSSRNTYPPSQLPATQRTDRPKLSINTQCPQAFGKKSTGLRLDTMSTTSPTARNTFKNAFDVPVTPQATRPLSQSAFSPSQTLSSSPLTSSESSAASLTSLESSPPSSTTTPDSSPETPKIPYVVQESLRSILTNSPHSKRMASRSCTKYSDRGKASPSSPAKKVDFRQPLVEEIETSLYILAHSDLPSHPASPACDDRAVVKDSTSRSRDCEVGGEGVKTEGEDEDAQYPKTPLGGRRKRRRHWTWTLGPIDGADGGPTEPDPEEEFASPTKRAAPSVEYFSKMDADGADADADAQKDEKAATEGGTGRTVPLMRADDKEVRFCP